jgi:hypothetical protein
MGIGHGPKDEVIGVLGIDITLDNLDKMEKNGQLW